MELEYLRDEIEVDTKVSGFTKIGNIEVANDLKDYQTGVVTKIGRDVNKVKVGDEIVFLTKALQTIELSDLKVNLIFEEHACAKIVK